MVARADSSSRIITLHLSYMNRLISKISWEIRKKIFRLLMEELKPSAATTILDVGVKVDAHEGELEANYLEKMYPWPDMITGVTTENPSGQLFREFSRLRFVRGNGLQLPFKKKGFDIAFSSSVVEHVGSRRDQERFVNEISRVGKKVFLATPNRFFPIEVHTRLPFVGFLAPPPIPGISQMDRILLYSR